MDELKSPGKPFEISKREVWEAYEKVKANKGAPGVDGVSIEEFEKDLKNNLYKIWNRMSSGSYFPPPVRAVEIPKPHGGGTRILGVPTVADRIAQTVVARVLEAKVEPIFHPDSYGYRPGRSALDAVAACRQRCWKHDWVIDLDIQKFFDSVPWDLIVKAVEANTDQPWVVLYVQRWLARAAAAARRDLAAAGPRNPAGFGGLARARQSVPALRVRCVDGPGVPGRRVRTLRRRRGGALRQRSARHTRCSRRSRSGWREVGLALHPDKTRIVYCKDGQAAWLVRAHRRSRSWGSRSGLGERAARTGRCSPRSCPRSARTP